MSWLIFIVAAFCIALCMAGSLYCLYVAIKKGELEHLILMFVGLIMIVFIVVGALVANILLSS